MTDLNILKSPSQSDRERLSLQLALDVFQRIFMAIKISKLYDINNQIFVKHIDTLQKNIKRSIELDGEASFYLRQGTLYFNNYKLKTSFANYPLLRYIIERFQNWQIGILTFGLKVSEENLTKFILLFGKKAPKTRDKIKYFRDEMEKAVIKHIQVEKTNPQEQLSGKKQDAAKVFFLSVTHIKEVFERHKEEKRISLVLTRRLIQSIYNHLTHNEPFLMGMTTIKNFDEYTLNHSVNVSILSIALGKRLGLFKNELADLGISAFFHDLGKVDIPKEILIKPGKLSDDEMAVMRKHPQYGAEKLIQMNEFHFLPLPALNVAMEHHAGDDKKGYPIYMRKSSINLYSKIVKVTDVFDALTTQRPYRQNTFTRLEALNLMIDKLHSEFDPLILKVFVNMIGPCPVGSLVLLDRGELAIVFEENSEPVNMLRPKVKLITDSQGNKIDGEFVDLAESEGQANNFKRSIVKFLDPTEYDITISDYFVMDAQ